MLKEIKMYTVICDNCGKDVNEGEQYSCWSEMSFAEDIAIELDWLKEDTKHYCPDCFNYGDNDEIIINESRTKK